MSLLIRVSVTALVVALLVSVISTASVSQVDTSAQAGQQPTGNGPSPPPAPAGGLPESVIGPRPTVASLGDRHLGPTPNITTVANRLGLRRRSLTTVVFVPAGLVLTRPVTISIVYISPATVPQRIDQLYVAATGNRFVYHDAIGDGTVRRMTMSITLTQPRLGGAVFSYEFFWQADLDPLFDVAVGPLRFELLDDCDWFGDSEIETLLILPDNTSKRVDFDLSEGESRIMSGFQWSRAEVSASANLRRPFATFMEDDWGWNPAGPPTFEVPDLPPLIPGTTEEVSSVQKDDAGDGCRGEFTHTIEYTPRFYDEL